MYNALRNALLEWNRETDDREKMQHAYVVIVIFSVLIAGIVSLIDQETGEDILKVTLVAGAIWIVNAVLWSLLDSMLVSRLVGRRKKQ